MGKNLVIVESPAKAKTISGFLGKDFVVKSSFGHVRDLSKKQLGVDIENVRVGKMTNWDKLVLDIETDGTITPTEAFKKSNQILIDQFTSLSKEITHIFI